MTEKREKGFIALTSVLIIGAIVLILAISLFHSALTDYSISTAYESGQQAAFLADFCLKEGIVKIQEDINYIGGEEIGLNNATCTINFVKLVDENTKEISSLGRTGDQPHFSRASQQIRYIIEPGDDGWVLEGEGASWDKVEVKETAEGFLLELTRLEAEVVTRTTDSCEDCDDWANAFYATSVDFTEDGVLKLAEAVAPPPPEEPSLECGDTTADSIRIDYKFNNASDARLYRNSTNLIAKLGSGTRSGSFTDTGLSYNTSYLYTLKDYISQDEEIFLASTTCVTLLVKPEGEFCEGDDECQSGHCYIDEDGDHYVPVTGSKKCQADPQLTGIDCCDTDPRAHPNQTDCYSDTRSDCGGYDFNCDNIPTRCVSCYNPACSAFQPCGYSGACYSYSEWFCLNIGVSTVTCR